MTEEKAKKAQDLLIKISDAEQRLKGLSETEADLSHYSDIQSTLYTIKENSQLFEPTLKIYAVEIIHQEAEMAKIHLDELKKELDEL